MRTITLYENMFLNLVITLEIPDIEEFAYFRVYNYLKNNRKMRTNDFMVLKKYLEETEDIDYFDVRRILIGIQSKIPESIIKIFNQ